MKRTQVQLPEPLYRRVKRLAEAQDWSITEVLRRGAEYMVEVYGVGSAGEEWTPPEPLHLGRFRTTADQWREVALDEEGLRGFEE